MCKKCVVSDVLDELYGRAGFDAWWDSVDKDTQNEIIQWLEEIVDDNL